MIGTDRARWRGRQCRRSACSARLTLWGQARLRSSDRCSRGESRCGWPCCRETSPQDEKWNPANRDAITDRYLSMTRQALAQGATFIMWPESATPLPFEQDILGGAAIRRLAVESSATLLDRQRSGRADQGSRAEPRSRSRGTTTPPSWCSPTAPVGAVYRKMHLVPFGEYVPLQSRAVLCRPDHRRGRRVLVVYAGHRCRCCCRSAITSPAPRSATR